MGSSPTRPTFPQVTGPHRGSGWAGLIAAHGRKAGGKQTGLAHYPPEKIAFRMRTPAWCRTKATDIGPARVWVLGELLADNALFRLRAAQGVLGLADKHGAGGAPPGVGQRRRRKAAAA